MPVRHPSQGACSPVASRAVRFTPTVTTLVPLTDLWWYSPIMYGTHRVVVGDRGRLVVPAEVRERTGLTEGTTLVLLETPRGLVFLTREQLRDRVRADLAGLDLVGELLADRRAEAAREDTA